MKRSLTYILIAGSALALASCGDRKTLTPPEGETLPVAARGADDSPTASELLEPSQQARPERSVELLRLSEERDDDEFDLPPE